MKRASSLQPAFDRRDGARGAGAEVRPPSRDAATPCAEKEILGSGRCDITPISRPGGQMARLVATRVMFRNGERTSMLQKQGGLPVHEAVLFVNSYRIKGRAANTIHQVVRSLALLYRELNAVGIQLLERLESGLFLTIPEVHRLAESAQFRVEDLDDADQINGKQAKRKVVSLERLRMRHRATKERRPVEVETRATRLRYFAGYMEFLTDYVAATLPPEKARQLEAESKRAVKALREHIPKGGNRTKLDARKGLSEEDQKRLLNTIHPDSPSNPWKRPFVRKRNFLIVAVLLASGLRRGELLNLQIRDLVTGSPKLRVVRRPDSKADKRKKQETPKTNEHEAALNPAVMKALWNHISTDRHAIKAARKVPQVFVSDEGEALSGSSIDKMFAKIRKACPGLLVYLTSHVTRHSWNDGFSEVAEKMNLSEAVEEKARNSQQGWRENSKMAATYTRRFSERKGREVSLKLQEKLEETLNESK